MKIANALPKATSTLLAEASRYIQWLLYSSLLNRVKCLGQTRSRGWEKRENLGRIPGPRVDKYGKYRTKKENLVGGIAGEVDELVKQVKQVYNDQPLGMTA